MLGSPSDLVVVDDRKDYALLRINRADKGNAMSRATRQAMLAAMESIRKTHKVVVVTGTGKAFCAGIDLKEASEERASGCETGGREWIEVLLAMRRHPAIFIAAVNGYALGGGTTLINIADLAIAADEAQIGMPEIGFATYPGMSGPSTQIMLGRKAAAWLVLTGKRIDGRAAERMGLVNVSVPLANLDSETDRLARHVAQFDAVALSESKFALDVIPTRIGDFAGGFDFGARVNASIASRTKSQTEGLAAFARGERNVGQGGTA